MITDYFPVKRLRKPVLLAIWVAAAPLAHSASFGIFDARGLAMGGAVVASATTQQAQYYNPALLAFHAGREEDTRDGRFIFPTAVFQASDNVESAAKAIEDELDGRLSDAIGTFNANGSPAAAGAVAEVAGELERVLRDLSGNDIDLDAFTGLAVSEPSDWEGGAFYLGFRLIGVGSTQVSDADFELLNAYVSGMETLAEGGAISDLPPEILDENGALIDPTGVFNSSADVAALGLMEWGVAMSTSFEGYGQLFSVGITPKVLRAIVYREQVNFDTGSSSFSDSNRTFTSMNLDVGFAAHLGQRLRLGLAVKDVVPEDFETAENLTLSLRPRARFGAAWLSQRYSVGLDYDVRQHQPIAGESPSQDLSLGVEYAPFSGFAVQVGYRQDTTGVRDDTFSGGVSVRFKKLITQLSYAKSAAVEGGALQISWAF